MAFTGMRPAAVLQLTAGDIRSDAGTPYISVNADAEGKGVKTGERRHVPIHPALVREGFLRYVAGLTCDAPLFPDEKSGPSDKRGERTWNTIGRWVRNKVGISDRRKKPNYGWRHRMADELRAVGAPKDVRDAIRGNFGGRHRRPIWNVGL
ncbi:MAG: hypothetical protein IRZ13_14340 [Acetobacteraceae bacterium]|nr:hypothetical protein [Acetobacteraceae bacterium]